MTNTNSYVRFAFYYTCSGHAVVICERKETLVVTPVCNGNGSCTSAEEDRHKISVVFRIK